MASRDQGRGLKTRETTTGYSYYQYATNSRTRPTTTNSRPQTSGTRRPGTARPRTGASTRTESQRIICAVSESRGVSPTVGLAFVNLDTAEAVMSQISDNQTYARTLNKIEIYAPSEVLILNKAAGLSRKGHLALHSPSTLFELLSERSEDTGYRMQMLDRKYFDEDSGIDYIHQLAFAEDVETIKLSVVGNFYAVCCFSACLKYIDFELGRTFAPHALRVKYEPPEGVMMIDISTIQSLELIQNLQDSKSKLSLYGLLKETLTPMGSRHLRAAILQPSTILDVITMRQDAVAELIQRQDIFWAVRQALKGILDMEKVLSALIVIPKDPTLHDKTQAINNVIMLKHFVTLIPGICEALTGARSPILRRVLEFCQPSNISPIIELINSIINQDCQFAQTPLELRHQRTFAVKAGVNGFLDVARSAFKEASDEALEIMNLLKDDHNLPLDLKYDNTRSYFLRVATTEVPRGALPSIFTNIVKRGKFFECQTLDLMKINQKIMEAHLEIIGMSDESISDLIDELRQHMATLLKCCDSIAMLDMLAAFAHVSTAQTYTRPTFDQYMGVAGLRHPIREKFHKEKYIPNDVYATEQRRFQIITGCNMAGKSTYIRSVALMVIMTQIGCFIPARDGFVPIIHQLFARVNTDDSIEANVSTFAAEMREAAFILHNVDGRHSMAIIDEMGRGTSTRDGLAIAIAIAEALVESQALVWFATHFRDLAAILAERNGVINIHMTVDLRKSEDQNVETMTMLYKVEAGVVTDKHYGLKLAKLVSLPRHVVEVAEGVAAKLEARAIERKNDTVAVLTARKRKMMLDLREHLMQSYTGVLEDEVLTAWLRQLQEEFIFRMANLDNELREASAKEAAARSEEVHELETGTEISYSATMTEIDSESRMVSSSADTID